MNDIRWVSTKEYLRGKVAGHKEAMQELRELCGDCPLIRERKDSDPIRVFISHPYSDNPRENMRKVQRIVEYLRECDWILPISPLHLFSFYPNDEQREAVLQMCKDIIRLCDYVWVFGDSEGCREEAEFAKKLNIPVRYVYESNPS